MKKIMIIDDSAFMRGILKELLLNIDEKQDLSEAIEIYEADGKTNALKLLKKFVPDVILVDIVMQESEIEGINFLEAIKSTFELNKVIVISSVGQESVIKRCRGLGVIYYLQKPFNETEITAAVYNVLALREHDKEV